MKVRYNKAHLESHISGFLSVSSVEDLVEKLVKPALKETPRVERKGIVREVVYPDKVLGFAGGVTTNSLSNVFWAYRVGRKFPSRMVSLSGDHPTTKGLVVMGRWISEEVFQLFTCFPGDFVSPKEIHDKSLWGDGSNRVERLYVLEFWRTHALISDNSEEKCPLSEKIERELERGNEGDLRKLLFSSRRG